MLKRIIGVVFFIILFSCAYGQSQGIISIHDVLDEYIYNTNRVKILLKDYESKLLEYKIYKKSFLPSIELSLTPLSYNHSLKMLQNYNNGEYTNVEDNSANSFGGITVSQFIPATGGTIKIGSSVNYLKETSSSKTNLSTVPVNFSYNQQLFGGRKSFKYHREISILERDLALKNFCYFYTEEEQKVIELYINALISKNEMDYYEHICQLEDTLAFYAGIRFNLGKITEFEYNQIELNKINNKITYLDNIEKYQKSLRLLESELKIKVHNICDIDEIIIPEYLDFDYVLLIAKKNNPMIPNNYLQTKQSQLSFYTTKINNRFNANIAVSYGMNGFANNYHDTFNHLDRMQNITLSFTIPIIQWGANRDKIKIAQNQLETITLQQDENFNQFFEQIFNAVTTFNRCVKLINMSETKFNLSKKQFEFAVEKYTLGKINITELMTTENTLHKAKQDYLNVQGNLYTQFYKIRHLTLYDFAIKEDILELLCKKIDLCR